MRAISARSRAAATRAAWSMLQQREETGDAITISAYPGRVPQGLREA
jgi:hypothetical protein